MEIYYPCTVTILDEARRTAKEKQIGILIALHDLNQALELGDTFFLMKDGYILYAGGKAVITEMAIREVFDAEVRIVEIDSKKIILNGGKT